MHSVSESFDGIMPDPLQVVCHMATLIIEGRMPYYRLQSSADPSGLKHRKPKPYYEGLHCPTVVGGVPKQGNHRCSEQSTLCIRQSNLRHHLELLGTSFIVEVYLAPECSCAELRCESTLVSTPAGASDMLLEQWDVNVYNKRSQDPPTALANLYQAVRSALHFSQLAAWYVISDGRQPAHVVYRVCAIRDAAQPLGSMTHHRFPIGEIDKFTSLTLSVISLPRTERIPRPMCSVHMNDGSSQSGLVDKFRSHVFPSPLRFSFEMTACDDVKGKSRNRTCVGSEFDEPDVLDGLSVQGIIKKSVKDYSKVIKPSNVTIGVCLMEHMSPEDVSKKKLMEKKKLESVTPDTFSTDKKLLVTDLVDDRMHISCRVAGKHHCENSMDEDQDQEQACARDVENRSRRRRSVSRARPHEQASSSGFKLGNRDSEPVLHGKFKDVYQEIDIPSIEDFVPQITSTPITNRKLNVHAAVNKEPAVVVIPYCLAVDNNSKPQVIEDSSPNPFLDAILRSAENKLLNNLQFLEKSVSEMSTNTDISFADYPPDAKFVLKKMKMIRSAPELLVHNRHHSGPFTSLQKMTRSTSTDSDVSGGLPNSHTRQDCKESSYLGDSTLTRLTSMDNSNISGSENAGASCCESPGMSRVLLFGSLYSGHRSSALPLLGTFEENALQGRLKPLAVVKGYTADLGASGSFFPPHIQLPVTVSFLSTREDFSGSTPYLCQMNLDKKGYNVPRSGTIQMTLFNPQKTVVHMFVVKYDLEEMPPDSCTFLRQRTLFVPNSFDTSGKDLDGARCQNFSKYLIHLRFSSGKTGKIYLHTDIKFVIFHRADADTASMIRLRGEAKPMYKLVTQTTTPSNPKYSSKK